MVEIYNPSTAPISLSGIEVRLFAHGATSPTTTQALSGTIAPGDVYVIANTGVVSPVVQAQADLQSSVCFFNGDDALLLLDGTDTLDIIGVIGQQPAGGWQLPGGGSTTNATIVRKATVQGGQKRWSNAAAEWQFLGTDVYTNVGTHTSTCATATATAPMASFNKGLEVYPNPAADNLYLRLPNLRGSQLAVISLCNALGQEVRQYTRTLTATEAATIDLRQVAGGLYFVRVTAGGVRYTSRVAIQR